MKHEVNEKTIYLKVSQVERKVNQLLEAFNANVRTEDRLITVKEAAKMLGVSVYKVRQEIACGNLKAQQNGRAYKLSFLQIQKIIGGNYYESK